MTTIIETTDAASNSSTQYAMVAGDVFFGAASSGATDWIVVTLVAGHTYSFGAVGMGAVGSGMTDPFLKLRDANGTFLEQNDDGGPGFCADLSFTAATSGTYYIEVKALSGATDGAYGLVLTEGDRPSYGVEMGAAVLYRDGSSWAATPETAVVVSWGVRAFGPAEDASGNPAPFAVLTTAQIGATERALDMFAEVGNISFNRVNPGGTTNNATILVGAYTATDDGAGAYAYFPGSTAPGNSDGDLWINNDSVSKTNIPVGSYDYFVFLHELGHAMGLEHPGDYNAAPGVTITYENSAQFIEDSQQYSVMSYFYATDTEARAPTSYCDTLMLYDIFALQEMYGVNSSTRSGNDTYGFHATTLGGAYDFTVNTDPLMCIWDGAGIDTLDLSGFGGRQVIDLNDGAFSNVGGFRGNLSIALGAQIENAVGGRGNDQIYGNELGNVLRGGKGVDILFGDLGNDRMSGNAGADGFFFVDGGGRDKITDFNKLQDLISLSSDLWGGATKTEAEVVAQFAVIRNGVVVFDFGADELTLMGVGSVTGLADVILLF
jgi:serralysin